MNKTYKHLFFDLDHTLWDHVRNANQTLMHLYQEFGLTAYNGFTEEEFTSTFHQINHMLWHDYHLGKVDQVYIRKERFRMVLEALNVNDYHSSETLGEQYLQQCPRKGNLMPYAIEILQYLHQKYPMTIITNGFDEIQQVKLATSGIAEFFDSVVTSENAGYLKPHPGIFEFAMREATVGKEECLMIGDNPVTDISGAKDAGIDQVYYNSRECADTIEPTFTISDLRELRELL